MIDTGRVRWVSWDQTRDENRLYSVDPPAWADEGGPPMVPQYRMPGEIEVWISEPGMLHYVDSGLIFWGLAGAVVSSATGLESTSVTERMVKAAARAHHKDPDGCMNIHWCQTEDGLLLSDVFLTRKAVMMERDRLSQLLAGHNMKVITSTRWRPDFYQGYLAHQCIATPPPASTESALRARVRNIRVRRVV